MIDTILGNYGEINAKLVKKSIEALFYEQSIRVAQINDLHKLRVIYTNQIESFTLEPYLPRKINSVKIVIDNTIDYNYKKEDRSNIQALLLKAEGCDDILIIKNGQLTDASYCNVVLSDKFGLFTPSSCLLKGVRRQLLIDRNIIQQRSIALNEILNYEYIFFINSMIDLDLNSGLKIADSVVF